MARTDQRLLIKLILDAFLLVLALVPVAVLHFAVYPFKRGFHCNDQSLMYPYKDDTVTNLTLILVGLLVPFGAMLVNEGLIFFTSKDLKRHSGKSLEATSSDTSVRLCRRTVHPLIVSVYKKYGAFLFGGAFTLTLTNIMKYYIGRLRPHFFAVCKPDYSAFSCHNELKIDVYVDGDFCTGDADLVKKARLSHPSGHASTSMYCAVYLIIYLHIRFQWRLSQLVRPMLQMICLYLAVACCVSRISDYKHHWSDVLGGGLLGVVAAILTAFYASDLLMRPNMRTIMKTLNTCKKREYMLESPVSDSCGSPVVSDAPREYKVMEA